MGEFSTLSTASTTTISNSLDIMTKKAASNITSCITIQEVMFESIDLPAIQALFALLYILVCTAAIVGNALVLYVVTFAQISLSVRSVFIGCLAVSDLLMSLTSLPVTAVTIFSRTWLFPEFFCKLIGVFQVINYNRAINTVVFIWVLGYALALPVGIFSRATRYEGTCGVFCEEHWPDSDDAVVSSQRRMYGLIVLLLQFGIPVLLSSICYTAISRVMDEQLSRRRRVQQLLPDAENRLITRRSRANRMMVCMVFGLFISWMPLNAINLYRDFGDTQSNSWFSTIFALCHVTAMTSAVVNPLIYSWFNPNFREAINILITPLKQMLGSKSNEVEPFKDEIKLAVSSRLEPHSKENPL